MEYAPTYTGLIEQAQESRPARHPASPAQQATMPDREQIQSIFQRRHLLDLDDFSAAELRLLLQTTQAMKAVLARPVRKVPALQGSTVVNLFYENSTRTRISFELAAKNLSADVVNVTASGSSVAKGESLIDTVRTLQALGADFVIMRHSQSGAPYVVARQIRGSVINAGDGWHAHPTQALLDLFTMEEHLGSVAGRKVVILGDILHSRVARSNIWSLTTLGAEVILCGPPTLMPPHILASVASSDDTTPRRLRVEYQLERALEGADVVMALRLQKERQDAGLLPSLREYIARFGLTSQRLAAAKPDALVMHPGPMNEGVEIAHDVAYSDASVIEEQVTNGLAVRMAVLYALSQARQRA
ncbi:MAG TPA: aspartate carbamoyltransferase catalytic subunit [Ktedonobacterales bacterium]|jgi:aspartate carbamoyltransferase catalytic subunit